MYPTEREFREIAATILMMLQANGRLPMITAGGRTVGRRRTREEVLRDRVVDGIAAGHALRNNGSGINRNLRIAGPIGRLASIVRDLGMRGIAGVAQEEEAERVTINCSICRSSVFRARTANLEPGILYVCSTCQSVSRPPESPNCLYLDWFELNFNRITDFIPNSLQLEKLML